MALFKCKMCGGELDILPNSKIAQCEYCGTKQTIPDLKDEQRVRLFDRANHFRRNHEFDKAEYIYERLLDDDLSDAEAYWSLVLCRYGIDYVEDVVSQKRIPTINRTQFTAIYDDENYKSAIKYASADQKPIYEAEAKTINEIQKEILQISQSENPFDVFICYKESDTNGMRTKESLYAEELYNELEQHNVHTFYARITLEEKLGSEYEPYIFSALNSAKIMVVIGSSKENISSPWVKNEWNRFLSLIKKGKRKIMIPAFIDMDPYDLPDEFANLQAQDLSKLGWKQDISRGICKILGTPGVVEKNSSKIIPTKEELESLVRANYDSYAEKYPIILKENDLLMLQKELNFISGKYRYGGKNLMIGILATLAVTCILAFQQYYVAAVCLVLVFVIINILNQIITKKSLSDAINECRCELEEIYELPTLYEFNPELKKYYSYIEDFLESRQKDIRKQEIEAWQSNKDEIIAKREALREKKLNAVMRSYENEIGRIERSELNSLDSLDKEKELLERERDEKLRILPTLGFFHGDQKSEIRDRIEKIDQRLAKINRKNCDQSSLSESQRKKTEFDMERKCEKINKKIDRKFKVPPHPEEVRRHACQKEAKIRIRASRCQIIKHWLGSSKKKCTQTIKVISSRSASKR